MRGWWLVWIAACQGDGYIDLVIPDAAPDAPAPCTLPAQDCGAGLKCVAEAGRRPDGFCAPAGTSAIDAPCSPTHDLALDDCVAGGYCTSNGVLPPESGGTGYCRAICTAHGQCSPGQRCATTSRTFEPAIGHCVPTCAAFAACPSGMTCADHYAGVSGSTDNVLGCRVPGGLAVGAGCAYDHDCARDALCLYAKCRALCDGTHGCGAGSCTNVDGVGVCLP